MLNLSDDVWIILLAMVISLFFTYNFSLLHCLISVSSLSFPLPLFLLVFLSLPPPFSCSSQDPGLSPVHSSALSSLPPLEQTTCSSSPAHLSRGTHLSGLTRGPQAGTHHHGPHPPPPPLHSAQPRRRRSSRGSCMTSSQIRSPTLTASSATTLTCVTLMRCLASFWADKLDTST